MSLGEGWKVGEQYQWTKSNERETAREASFRRNPSLGCSLHRDGRFSLPHAALSSDS